MILEQLHSGFMGNFAYLIGDEETGKAAIVDPASGSRKVLELAKKRGLSIELVLVTHDHSDHIGELEFFRKKAGARVVAHGSSRVRADILAADGESVSLGNFKVQIIHTPGHSPDSVCYLVDGNLFTGDTLFVGECGRTDLAGGDSRALYHSLFRKLMSLPGSTKVWPGHDYGKQPSSTMKNEKETSYILEKRSEEEFMKFMGEP